MNLDELDNSPSDSDPGHSIDPEPKDHTRQRSSQEALSLPSVPFDPEWVSPFTLPPLPALRKNRGQSKSNLLRSPDEHLHQRSSSSAYYAAAWGSPYATPSPSRSPHLAGLARRRSQDFETASPLSLRTRDFTPGGPDLGNEPKKSICKPPSIPSGRKRASSWDRAKSLSERFNWLSESESDRDTRAGKTPTKETYLKSLKASIDKAQTSRTRSHQVQESVATITPETFNAKIDNLSSSDNNTEASQASMEQDDIVVADAQPLGSVVDKPLPSLPPLGTEKSSEPGPTIESPDSPSRPRIASMQSFQRPKRKVPWKGKTCIIALPLTDRESAGLAPILTAEEFQKRMQRWIAEGYSADELMMAGPRNASSSGFGQSRPLFPDHNDMVAERKDGGLHVHIPDQSEWDAWVDYLKEEKLRALGVTPSNSEAPMSVQSPFSSTLSRVSSTYPSVAASPPIGTPSVNGNQVRIASNTFSPQIGHQNPMLSRGNSHGPSPSISGYPGPMHGYKQSMAQPRLTSPYDYPISHPGSFAAGMRSTSGGFGTRQFSPPSVVNLQSFGQVLSPMIPNVPSNDNGRGMSQHPTMEQIRQQQQRQQQLHQQLMQHQRSYSYFPPPQSRSADQLPRTPTHESPARFTPEIMHPTPRSHRHNLSAALQKGVDDLEAARSDHDTQMINDIKQQDKPEAVDEKKTEVVEEEEPEPEPELPVLKRPEISHEADDKSEIETNPSIAASPLLVDGKNPFAAPFANFQQIQDALQPQSQHKPKLSMSKLNVKAPEFDPHARFSSSNFAFGAEPFQPAVAPAVAPAAPSSKSLVGGIRPSMTTKNLSISKLSIDAPVFTPSFVAQTTPAKDTISSNHTPARPSIGTPSKASFTFSSPSFNVDAPEFKPGQSFSFTANNSSLTHEEPFSFTSAGSIFGNVSVDPNSKVNRRGGKAIPITRPKSSDSKNSEAGSEPEHDDEEGRVRAPSDRQKRARRVGDEEEEELLFADSAPFNVTEGLSSKTDGISSRADEVRVSDPVGDSQTIQAQEAETRDATEQTQDSNPEIETGLGAEEVKEEGSPPLDEATTAQDEKLPAAGNIPETDAVTQSPLVEVAKTEDAAPEARGTDKSSTLLADDLVKTQVQEAQQQMPVTAASQIGHKSKFSLSALAKPFEFRPGGAMSFVPQEPAIAEISHESKNTKGLMASRFAHASPELEPAVILNGKTSASSDVSEHDQTGHTDFNDSISTQEPPESTSLSTQPLSQVFEDTPQLVNSVEELIRSELQIRAASRSSSQDSRVEDAMPSYEEIDAVMKQFEDNPDLGVERDDTPVKSTPLIDMRLAPVFRSDAPSPSPRRIARSPQRRGDWGLGIHKLNDGHEEVSDWNDEFSPRQEDKLESQAQYFDSRVNNLVGGILEDRLGPLEQILQMIQGSLTDLLDKRTRNPAQRRSSTENREDSDADDEDDFDASEGFSTYRSRSPSRNQRKADKIKAVVMEAMAAYQPPKAEQPAVDMTDIHAALQEMRQLSKQAPAPKPPVVDMTEVHATLEEMRQLSRQATQAQTPVVDLSEVHAALHEIRQLSKQAPPPEPPIVDMTEVHAALDEIRKISQPPPPPSVPEQPDIRALMEDVISTHPYFKTVKSQEDYEAVHATYKFKIEALEVSLKEAEKRAVQEVLSRQQADEEVKRLDHKLLEAQKEATLHREASEEAQTTMANLMKDKDAYELLQSSHVGVLEKNQVLEDTLAEYRTTSDQFRGEIKLERARNEDLIRRMHHLREDFNDKLESRQALRAQMEHLQARMAQVLHDVHAEEKEWRDKEHGLIVQNKTIQAALEHEIRHCEKIELELDNLDKEHKENLRVKSQYEHAQQDIARLQEQVAKVNDDNKAHQDKMFRLERELSYAKESANGETVQATARLQAELEAAQTTIDSLKSDSDAQILRLQKRLDDAELDLEEQKANHDSRMSEVIETQNQALQEADQKREAALEEQHASHERKLNDLRERHTRALHNSSDDRHRLEHQLNEKLAINDERTKHLESQIRDLEERLEISKTATIRAAEVAEAAQAETARVKAAALPTPASSVVASPPHRPSGASLQMMKGTDVPEKISPQAMRESIMVLQDQLQNREQTIEQLETEVASLDKEAPAKIKERDNEIALLRELLSVRVDDLDEIIATLAQPKFDREATKNAAIRLKANLQMEQQLKERAANTGTLTNSLPSISTISNLAQSPRGLPMAAAAAWGNWRKARDFSINAVSDIASNISQTPSKPSPGSPSSFLAGIMTPPSTSQRTPPPPEGAPMSPPTMRPLAAAALAKKNSGGPLEARPLRTYSSQARTLSSRQAEKRRESNESTSSEASKRYGQVQSNTPITPLANKSSKNLDFEEDIDDDASPFDVNQHEQDDVESTPKELAAA